MSFIYRFTDGEEEDYYHNADAPILVSDKIWIMEDLNNLIATLKKEHLEKYEEPICLSELTDELVDNYGFKYLSFDFDIRVPYEYEY